MFLKIKLLMFGLWLADLGDRIAGYFKETEEVYPPHYNNKENGESERRYYRRHADEADGRGVDYVLEQPDVRRSGATKDRDNLRSTRSYRTHESVSAVAKAGAEAGSEG